MCGEKCGLGSALNKVTTFQSAEGEFRPVTDNDIKLGRTKNRREVIMIVANLENS